MAKFKRILLKLSGESLMGTHYFAEGRVIYTKLLTLPVWSGKKIEKLFH